MAHVTQSDPTEATDTSAPAKTDSVRLSVNMNTETAAALRKLANEQGISVTEAVRRAVAIYDFVEEERSSNRRILTSSRDNTDIRELILM